jgi:hypothetical protein
MTASTNPREDIEIFRDYCVRLRSAYLHGEILYERTSPEHKALMERAASVFFGDLNHIIICHVILEACKITDPANYGRKNENLTVAFLLQHYDFSANAETSRRLNELHDRLLAFTDRIRPARNKLISHIDRSAVLEGIALGAATKAAWRDFWSDLQELVSLMCQHVLGEPPFSFNQVGMLSDADGLVRAMQHGSYFDRLLHEGDPQLARKCVDLALG